MDDLRRERQISQPENQASKRHKVVMPHFSLPSSSKDTSPAVHSPSSKDISGDSYVSEIDTQPVPAVKRPVSEPPFSALSRLLQETGKSPVSDSPEAHSSTYQLPAFKKPVSEPPFSAPPRLVRETDKVPISSSSEVNFTGYQLPGVQKSASEPPLPAPPRLVRETDKSPTSSAYAANLGTYQMPAARNVVPSVPSLPGLPTLPSYYLETAAMESIKVEWAPVDGPSSEDEEDRQGTGSLRIVQEESSAPRRRRVKKQRRVPEMRQMSAVECGAACLAMILNYYGHATSVSEVQERCGVGRDGLSALAIAKAARLYGLRVLPVSLKENDFRFVTLPAIVHWEFNHFVIVERWSPKWVDIVDPALGYRRLSADEFDESFTGVVLMLEPGTQFEQKAPARSLSLWTYMRSLLYVRGIVGQIIGASLLLQLLGLGAPLLTAIVVDQIIPDKADNLLTLLGLGILILIITQGVATLLRTSLLIYLQARIDTAMRINFFEHLLSLPYRFFQMRLSGDLLARVNSNSVIRDLLTNQMVSTLLDASTMIVYLAILIWQSSLLAEVTIAIGCFQVVLLLVTGPIIRKLTQKDLTAQGKTQGYLNEALAGIATLKAAGAEHRALARWTSLFFDEMNISLRLSYLTSVIGILLEISQLLAPLLLLWVGAMQVIDGNMSIGTMLALNTLAASFLGPLTSLATSGQSLQIARAHFDRISDVVGAKPEQDPQQVQTPPRLTGRLDLKKVGFQYDQHAPMVLRDITVSIRRGQKVALVGRTGSGKSTLGKLLIGLITPTKGNILFDGIPLHKLNYQEVRSQFGVVLQESFIFSGSVRENIALNNPEMGMEQIVRAAQAAAIHEDIEKMSMGYETLVSEGGSAFSGGQRQRLALARALANRPAILLLDEATSALDVATERTVERNLNAFAATQIIIAHRLSTIRNADVILVLHEGRIVEQGTHDVLLRRNGYYAQLIQTQTRNGEIEVA